MWPLFFATVAFFMFESGGGEQTLLYASLGASVMGIWSVTSTSAGGAMQRERWQGTLEVLVASPAPFALVLLPVTIATTTIGLYCMVATLLWGRLLFGIELTVEQPLLFALSIPVAIVSIGTFGFLLAVAFVRYRFAWALGNLLEYPVWLIAGFLVPLTILPAWVRPLSWALAPTWGVDAIRDAATGAGAWPEIALALTLGAVYLAIGIAILETVLSSARRAGTLALA
jgi:ABC-2 type transport system permease protein